MRAQIIEKTAQFVDHQPSTLKQPPFFGAEFLTKAVPRSASITD
jgi:hypothetical protein